MFRGRDSGTELKIIIIHVFIRWFHFFHPSIVFGLCFSEPVPSFWVHLNASWTPRWRFPIKKVKLFQTSLRRAGGCARRFPADCRYGHPHHRSRAGLVRQHIIANRGRLITRLLGRPRRRHGRGREKPQTTRREKLWKMDTIP